MKTYATWEVIKMLTENNYLKFRILNKKVCTQTISINIYKNLITSCKGCNGEKSCGLSTDDKWVLVQEPVSFMEAIKSKKKIRVEHPLLNTEYFVLDDMLDKLCRTFLNKDIIDILTNGKWYIKEDEE